VYFPRGFDREKALQLAEFVVDAYGQLAAFQEDKAWTLPEACSLLAELHYTAAPARSRQGIIGQLNAELRRVAASRLRKHNGLPIGFVAADRSDVYLVFRGTMTPRELFHDFSINLSQYPYAGQGRVHDGFLQMYEKFRPAMLECLNKAGPGKRLFITGHSLGAALATLAAPDISASTPFTSPVVYTFASPRVGDREFAEEYNRLFRGRTFRIANTCDIVVSIPFPVPFLAFIGGFFTHVDEPVEFTAQQEDLERNHAIGTYRGALLSAARPGGFFKSLFTPASEKR
jgi:triacylglycerol lipase